MQWLQQCLPQQCRPREGYPARPRSLVRVLAFVAVLALLVVACAGTERSSRGATPLVVVTTDIWADVVSEVSCDGLVAVESVIPAGVDPHDFEPSLADRQRLEAADLVVANGLGLEEGMVKTIEAIEAEGSSVFRVTKHVPTISQDPHVWLDPVAVDQMLVSLTEELARSTSVDAEELHQCRRAFSESLLETHGQIQELIRQIEPDRRLLVTNHDSLSYFAARYDFEVIGTVIPGQSSLAATNPADLERLAGQMEVRDVSAIFTDADEGADDAEAVADRVGNVRLIPLQSGSLGPPDSENATYLEFLAAHAHVIVDALK